MKYTRFCNVSVGSLLFFAIISLGAMAVDEDSGTLFERGILNWLQYQKIQLSDNVYKINIQNSALHTKNLEVVLEDRGTHGTLIIENNDETNHRIVFTQHIGNDLSYDIRSPAIAPGERWALDILKDGIYPFHCSIHPEIKGILQVWYEEDDFW